MFRYRRILRTAWPRRGVALLLAVTYGYLVAGVPLPSAARNSNGQSAERYPCENCSCGCASADECWRHCCCHTLTERLAWAEREGVTPPAYVLAQIEAELAKPACCRTKSSCCSTQETKSCCSKVDHNDSPDPGVIGWCALACQGHKMGLVATPTVVPTAEQLIKTVPRITWLGPHRSDIALSLSYPPAEPPPRLLVG
jgi:hypothetical protein